MHGQEVTMTTGPGGEPKVFVGLTATRCVLKPGIRTAPRARQKRGFLVQLHRPHEDYVGSAKVFKLTLEVVGPLLAVEEIVPQAIYDDQQDTKDRCALVCATTEYVQNKISIGRTNSQCPKSLSWSG